MGGKISIIVPVYRVKRYLAKCIESVLLQSYENWEMILVNDGSPDSSPKIAKKYSFRDTRIRVIDKENGGVSSARNAGLSAALGEYVLFLDADDWLPRSALSRLVCAIETEGADLAIGSMLRIHLDQKHIMATEGGVISVDGSNAFAEYIFRKENPLGYIASKLYKRRLIEENGIRFDTQMRVFEDAVFTYEYLKYCRKISRTPAVVYCYNQILADTAVNKYYGSWGEWALRRHGKLKELLGEATEEKAAMAAADMSRLISEVVKYYYMRTPDKGTCLDRLGFFLPLARGCLDEREERLLAIQNPDAANFDPNKLYDGASRTVRRPSLSKIVRMKRRGRRLLSRIKEFFVFAIRPAERFSSKNYKRG